MNGTLLRTPSLENGVWVALVHPKQVLLIDPLGRIVARNGLRERVRWGTESQIVLSSTPSNRPAGGVQLRGTRLNLSRGPAGDGLQRRWGTMGHPPDRGILSFSASSE